MILSHFVGRLKRVMQVRHIQEDGAVISKKIISDINKYLEKIQNVCITMWFKPVVVKIQCRFHVLIFGMMEILKSLREILSILLRLVLGQ